MSYTYKYPHFAVTTDNVIFNIEDATDIKVLLITRKNEPYKGCFALPGGFLDQDDMSGMSGALRELKEETGLNCTYLTQVCTLTRIGRDPRERCISIVYSGLYNGKHKPVAQDDAATVQWVSLNTLRKDMLAFDHATAIWKSIDVMFNDMKLKTLLDTVMVLNLKTLLDTVKFNLGQTFLPIF